jgi:hypothetical protein
MIVWEKIMARVGKARVLGSSVIVYIEKVDGSLCKIGEIDKFSAKENMEIKKSRPLGAKLFASQIDPQGWDLSFEGGKVDWQLAALLQAQGRQFYNDGRSPYFSVVQEVRFSDNTIERYRYFDVTLHSPNLDAGSSSDEVSEKFEGFAAYREVDGDDTVSAAVTEQASVVAALLAQMTSQQPGDKPLADNTGTNVGN